VTADAMQTITSTDGAPIAYWRSGSGPPLVLVHGSISDRTAWALVQPALEQRFTVYAMHRRGREGSAAGPHTMQQEFEDVASAVDAVGEPVHLAGHSFGAVCSVEATRLTSNVRSLTLYEPPSLGGAGAGLVANAAREFVRQGRGEDVISTFLTQAIQLTDEQVGLIRASPVWPHMVGLAGSLAEELAASEDYRFDASRFAGLAIPVLLLAGADSPQRACEVIDALAKVLPNTERRDLAGERHMAMLSSPDLFVSEVVRFIESVEE